MAGEALALALPEFLAKAQQGAPEPLPVGPGITLVAKRTRSGITLTAHEDGTERGRFSVSSGLLGVAQAYGFANKMSQNGQAFTAKSLEIAHERCTDPSELEEMDCEEAGPPGLMLDNSAPNPFEGLLERSRSYTYTLGTLADPLTFPNPPGRALDEFVATLLGRRGSLELIAAQDQEGWYELTVVSPGAFLLRLLLSLEADGEKKFALQLLPALVMGAFQWAHPEPTATPPVEEVVAWVKKMVHAAARKQSLAALVPFCTRASLRMALEEEADETQELALSVCVDSTTNGTTQSKDDKLCQEAVLTEATLTDLRELARASERPPPARDPA